MLRLQQKPFRKNRSTINPEIEQTFAEAIRFYSWAQKDNLRNFRGCFYDILRAISQIKPLEPTAPGVLFFCTKRVSL